MNQWAKDCIKSVYSCFGKQEYIQICWNSKNWKLLEDHIESTRNRYFRALFRHRTTVIKVSLYGVHLFHKQKNRKMEARESLLEAIKYNDEGNGHIIIAGDFNIKEKMILKTFPDLGLIAGIQIPNDVQNVLARGFSVAHAKVPFSQDLRFSHAVFVVELNMLPFKGN